MTLPGESCSCPGRGASVEQPHEAWPVIEREPEYEPVVPPDLVENDPCPMGCGGTTDDPYGGPCRRCWAAVPGCEADSGGRGGR